MCHWVTGEHKTTVTHQGFVGVKGLEVTCCWGSMWSTGQLWAGPPQAGAAGQRGRREEPS